MPKSERVAAILALRNMKVIVRALLSFVLLFGVAALVTFYISAQNAVWYASLVKPSFTPPNSLFAFVWILLYFFMAVALTRVWGLEKSEDRRRWVFAFILQLLLGILWAILFFWLHGLFLAVIEIVILWFSVVILTLDSWEIDHPSFWLLVPYVAGVTFAMIFNIALWWIN